MRKPTPLLSKLTAALGLTDQQLQAALVGWPGDLLGDCWRGPRKIFHEGRPRETLRLLVELAKGSPLPDGMRLRQRLCPTAGCLNPHHYRAVPYLTWREKIGLGEVGPRPVDLANAFDESDQDAAEFRDLCDLIQSGDGGRDRSAEDLHAQWPMFDLEAIRRALEAVRGSSV